ncbi:hypothetical protein Noda2021_00850 [Candidatus Dependentiae bacterium Noda2021]|nr:hypothetical protein Noda2021_00850 [Candidatus Dependentiae bacterium Noda2021]
MKANVLQSIKTYLIANLTVLRHPITWAAVLLSSVILFITRLILPQYFNYSAVSNLDFSSLGKALDQLENTKYLAPLKHLAHFVGVFLVIFLIGAVIIYLARKKTHSLSIGQALKETSQHLGTITYLALIAFAIPLLTSYLVKLIPNYYVGVLIPLVLASLTIAVNAYVLPFALLENMNVLDSIINSLRLAKKSAVALLVGLVSTLAIKELLQTTMEHFADKYLVNRVKEKGYSLFDSIIDSFKNNQSIKESFSQSLENISMSAGKIISFIGWLQNLIIAYVSFAIALYFVLVFIRFYKKSDSKLV